MIGHRSSVSTFISPEKRMNSARLREYLQRLPNSQPEFVLSYHQCRILVECMQKISQWLSQWEKASLSRPFVQELLTLSSKAMRLLDSCRNVDPSSWLCLVALKLDHEEYFSQLVQGFLEALNGYKQVAQDLPPPSIVTEKRCIKEATTLISCFDKHRLTFAALEDRRALIERLEQHRFSKEDEIRLSQFLLERLQDKEKLAAALQIDPQGIQYGGLIGQGTFGAVYEARWMGMDVAVKKCRYEKNLKRELEVLQKAGHVNVVQVLGHIPKARGERPCLVMERMMGDLGAFVNRVKEAKMQLPLLVRVEILQQIAAGMAYLHEKNIVHRDLKPENVLLDRWPPMSTRELNNGPCGFSAKIGDFGDSRTRMYDTTEATGKKGTACYRAPEVLCAMNENGNTPYSNKVDVWSYGMVCYKLLTGCDPCLSPENARKGDCSELQFPTNVPPAFLFFMKRCWQIDPRQRPPFKEVLEFLSLFKTIMLNTKPISCHWPPLYFGITCDLLAKLVSCLSKEWLMDEASLLNLRLISLKESKCEKIDGILLADAVASELAEVPAGQFLAGNCCLPKLQF